MFCYSYVYYIMFCYVCVLMWLRILPLCFVVYMVLFSFPFTFLLVIMYGLVCLYFVCYVWYARLCYVLLCCVLLALLFCYLFVFMYCFLLCFCIVCFIFQGMANCDFSILKLRQRKE